MNKKDSEVMHHYYAFGLNIESEFELPELLKKDMNSPADVIIKKGKVDIQEHQSWFYGTTSKFKLNIKDVGYYEIIDGKQMIIEPLQDNLDKIRVFLLGSAMGALLFQRGILPIHGSAIKVNNEVFVFSGHSGAGKSTLAQAFIQEGYQLMSDDVVAVEKIDSDSIFIHPAYPQQKLWSQSLDMYKIEDKNLKQIWEGEDKYRLSVNHAFSHQALSFTTLVQLNVSDQVDKLQVKEVHGAEKLKILIDETYRNFFAIEMGIQKFHFQLCSLIANQVKVLKLTRPIEGYSPKEMVNRIINFTTSKEERIR